MRNKLLSMIEEVQYYNRDKQDLMVNYVKQRLDDSLFNYNKELQQTTEFLQRKHEKSLLKRLNKLK